MTTESRTNEIFSTSLNNYKLTLADNVFDAFPLFDVMNKEGGEINTGADGSELRGGLVMEDSAADIIEPLLYGKNTTVKSYSGYDIIDTTPPVGVGNAKYAMKQVAGSVTIDRFTERQNSGEEALINLFSSKMEQLEMSFQDAISVMMHADGTGNGSLDIMGLDGLVSEATTNTIGGLLETTYGWWANYRDDGAQTSAAYDALIADMRTMYLNLCVKKQHPNFGVTSLAVYGGFEGKLLATINYNIGMGNLLRNADYGFENYKFHGVTLTFDNDATAGEMRFLNTKYLKFHVDKETYFEAQPFQKPYNQDARTAIVLLYAEMTTSNRRMQGLLHSIT